MCIRDRTEKEAKEKALFKDHCAYSSFAGVEVLDCRSFCPNSFQIVQSMVIKQAPPPMKLEMGSAKKTPLTPKEKSLGKIKVKGMTINALRSREKKIACLERPRPTAAVCPDICNAIIKKPKK